MVEYTGVHLSYRSRPVTRVKRCHEGVKIRYEGGSRRTVKLGGVLWVSNYPLTHDQLLSIEASDLMGTIAGHKALPHGLPFRRIDWMGVLSNGRLHLPITPPEGLPEDIVVLPSIGKVRLADWEHLIMVLENRTIEEFVAERSASKEMPHRRERRSIGPEERQVLALTKTGCFCLDDVEIIKVANNGRFAFCLGDQHNRLWLVDSIGIGALYIFVSEAEAMNWLTRQSSYLEARQQGDYVIHKGNWLPKAMTLIADYFGQPS